MNGLKLNNFSLFINRFVVVALSMLFLAFVHRMLMLLKFGDFSELKDYEADIIKSFFQGARFDILVIIYFLLPLLLFAFFSLFGGKNIFEKLSQFWSVFANVLFLGLLIGDYYYYSFFDAHFNMLIFGIVDDETETVLKSIWTDFPIIWIFLFFIGLSFVISLEIKSIYSSLKISNFSKNKIGKFSFLVIISLTVFFIRGSVGTFPLRMEDGFHSENQFLNKLTINGIFTLKDAYKDYQKNKFDVDIDKMLSEEGFASDEELVSQYLNIPTDSINQDPLLFLQKRTEKNEFLEKNPPHVVVVQMEGMGLNFMNLEEDNFQILGALKEELKHGILYKNFLPYSEGTNTSLEGIVTNSLLAPISQTKYYNKCILSSSVLPFKKNGYETSFVTGAKKAWRNFDVYLPAQGFDNFESRENIVHDIPNAVEQEWGVYDEFMFKQIHNRLKKAKKPQLIYGMTITNHTPYNAPKGYKADNMVMSDKVKRRLLQDEDICFNSFMTYRYACDYLGYFIKSIRESSLGENTIIAITGDHSIKNILQSSDNDILDKHGVPFILFVPEKYLDNKTIDTNLWASHKDIFPTLTELTLSNVNYYKLGNDLLAKSNTENFAFNTAVGAINNNGMVRAKEKQYFQWKSNNTLLSQPHPNKDLKNLENQIHIWKTVSKYITLRSL